MDRRLRTRFDLNAPATYSWKERAGVRRTGHGRTRDVSECGLFVLADSLPPEGTTIEFEVSFAFSDNSQIQMQAKGKVVRVEAGGNSGKTHGFAAATKVLWLQNPALNSTAGQETDYDPGEINRERPEMRSGARQEARQILS